MTSTPRRALAVAVVGVGAAAAVTSAAANGGGSPPRATAAATRLHLSARESGGLSFSRHRLTAEHGRVTLTLANPGHNAFPHGIAVEGNGVDKDGRIVKPGGTSTVTVRLKKGRYEFYCPVPGHKKAGMKGTLVVR